MAAFQQRRREQQRPPQPEEAVAGDDWVHSASPPGAEDDERPILLFGSPAAAIDSSQWTVVSSPRTRPARTISFTSSHASTDTSATSGGGTSLGSPFPLAQASLLPAHDGSGVFAPGDHPREPNETASLVQSDLLLPSVYVEVGSAAETSDDGATSSSSRFSRPAPSFLRRDSHASSTFSSFAGSDVSSRASSGWALTEEALLTLPTGGAHSAAVRGRSAGRGRGALPASADLADHAFDSVDDQEGTSAGATSGSEEDGDEQAGPGTHKRSHRRLARQGVRQAALAEAAAAAAQRQDDEDWAHSHLAMSAGFSAPPPRARRRRPSPSVPGRPLVSLGVGMGSWSPEVASSALRSLSPMSSAARSRTSSGYKRRHRRPGPGARDGETKKRSSAGIEAPMYGGEYFERVMREEDERARRMQELLRARKETEEMRLAQDRVLFGSAVRAYMSIDPATLTLLGTALTPTASASPTPTASRAGSPSRAPHGTAAFARHAARELRLSSFQAAEPGAEAESDAETEVEGDHAASARPRQPEEHDGGSWTAYSAAVPPAASLRRSSLGTSDAAVTGASTVHRSHSTSDLSGGDIGPPTGSALGLVLRPQSMRRSSSYSPASGSAPAIESSGSPHYRTDASSSRSVGTHPGSMAPAPSAMAAPATVAAAAATDHEATAWGGELDSFALALGYWKRLLRRLKEGAGLGPQDGPLGDAAATMVGGEGGVVRLVAAH